jgi:GNAT superfamily N-acetyltransferase
MKEGNRMSDLQIRVATNDDREQIQSLLITLAHWMQDEKINQWRFLLEGEDDELKQWISKGLTYIVEKDGTFIATFTLLPEAGEWDQHIWGDDLPENTVYLHRLAITPDFMRHGIGGKIMEWLSTIEKEIVRLDCVADNAKLNQFYLRNGFEFIGRTEDHCKYQKNIRNGS